MVLRLAGDRAGVAADALAVIDDESVAHRGQKSSRESKSLPASLSIVSEQCAVLLIGLRPRPGE